MDYKEKLEKCRTLIVINYGFFASLMMQLKIVKDDERMEQMGMPTMATNGKELIFHSKFVEKLTCSDLNFVIIHEIMHVAMGHMWRRNNRIPEIWNIACDYAINLAIMEICGDYQKRLKNLSDDELVTMPKEVLYDEKYKGMFAEQIYEDLMKNAKVVQAYSSADGDDNSQDENNQNNQGKGKSPSQRKGKGQSQGKGIPQAPQNHKLWEEEDKKSQAYKQDKLSQWDSNTQEAAKQMKNCGVGSDYIERYITSITKPQKNWRNLLREFIDEEVNDYSFVPPDRRYDYDGIFLPDFNDKAEIVKDVLFFIDTSGSMSPKEISVCFSEIQGAIDQFKKHLHGTLLFFDYDVKDKYYDFDDVHGDITKIAPLGGGGTNFDAPFEFVEKNKHIFEDVKGIIILTDGECNYPDEYWEKYKTLWIFTQDRFEEPPFGRFTKLDVE